MAILLSAAVLTVTGGANAQVGSRWVVRDLGTLPRSTMTEALAISDRGDIVGWSGFGGHAFLWRHGRMHDLGLGYAVDVNERGQVLVNRDTTGIARLWKAGKLTQLRPAPQRGSCLSSLGRAVNDNGVVVGWTASRDCNGLLMSISWEAARWAGGTGSLVSAQRLDVMANSEAVAVNNRGQILVNSNSGLAYVLTQSRGRSLTGQGGWLDEKDRVAGWRTSASKRARAFLWSSGRQTLLAPLAGFTDSDVGGISRTGDMNFTTYYPRVIDDAGEVVGESWSDSAAGRRCRPVMWSGGRVIDLTGRSARFCFQPVLNGAGVVGGTVEYTSDTRDPLAGRGFVWEKGSVTFLPTLGGKSSFVGAINNRGEIVGSATTATGARHAVVWTHA